MKVFWSDDYDRLYPVPATAVIVADTMEQAAELLRGRLRECRLKTDGFTLHEAAADAPCVVAFQSGDY